MVRCSVSPSDRLRVSSYRLEFHLQIRVEVTLNLHTPSGKQLFYGEGPQPPVGTEHTTTVGIVSGVITVDLIRHIRTLTEGGHVNNRSGN